MSRACFRDGNYPTTFDGNFVGDYRVPACDCFKIVKVSRTFMLFMVCHFAPKVCYQTWDISYNDISH